MALIKAKLGRFIELQNERNSNLTYGESHVRGVNISKQMMPTKADLTTRDLRKFQIVRPGWFVFNHRTSRNGSKFSIAFNDTCEDVICTEDYVVFSLNKEGEKHIVPEWLFMYFNRPEFDRYVITNSWGSSTEFFNWSDICDVELPIPPLEIQKKYVSVYLSIVTNQRTYERGLADVRLSCDAFYDRIKHENPTRIDRLVDVNNKKNQDQRYGLSSLRGISDKCRFADTTATVAETALDKYIIIDPNEFAVNFMCLGNWGKFYLAYNDSDKSYLVSPACSTLKIKSNVTLNPYYFLCLLQRPEFQRRCVFIGDGNTRGGINTNDFGTIEIPLIDVEKQRAIGELFQAYDEMKDINERLKAQIKDLCPILIKGSIEEASV